jgi:hypothetical protein
MRQGAKDGGPAAYLCTYLDNHGVKPEKVLKKAGITVTDWDDPASVNALYVASAKYWPRTVRSDSDAYADSDADGQTMPPALPLHPMIVTEFLLPLWGAYGVCFFCSLSLSLSGFLRLSMWRARHYHHHNLLSLPGLASYF